MRILTTSILAMVLVLVQGSVMAAQQAEDTLVGVVVRVVDGDTLKLHTGGGEKYTVRLRGADTPETVHPFKPVEFYGPEASTFLTNLLLGETVTVDVTGRAAYNRTEGYVYRWPDGLDVCDELIRQGYAVYDPRYPVDISREVRWQEWAARNEGIAKGVYSNDSD